jgi:hypothetical protein
LVVPANVMWVFSSEKEHQPQEVPNMCQLHELTMADPFANGPNT